jgi:8-amino-7-oxononanoate synthase
MKFCINGPVGAHTILSNCEVDYFAGNGYLGLQNRPEVIHFIQETLQAFGFSTATSRGGYGEHILYDDLEKEVCSYFDAEKVIITSSGYLGASILTQATSKRFDHIFIDSKAHFSLWDAALITNLPITPFSHISPENLSNAIRLELQARE